MVCASINQEDREKIVGIIKALEIPERGEREKDCFP